MIGARTIAALLVCASAGAWSEARGALSWAALKSISPSAALIVGLFAALAVVLVVALWHPVGNSVFAIGIHRRRPWAGSVASIGAKARDLPRAGQQLTYFAAFFCIGLGSFDAAAAAQIEAAWSSLGAPGSEYCREPSEVAAAPAPVRVADQRGCALVRRAYELGYEKSLGTCAPPSDEPTDPASTLLAAPCSARQADEPLFHYMWRLVGRRSEEARKGSAKLSLGESVDAFKIKLGYAGELFAVPKHAVLGSPHAAHHIFTNLPAPRRGSFLSRTLSRERCALPDDPPNLDWSAAAEPASALLEHAVYQLVLSRRLGSPSLSCNEISIHWGAPIYSCSELVSDPWAALDRAGATDSVRAVLERQRSVAGRAELETRLGGERPSQPIPPPGRVVSFSCLMVGQTGSKRAKARIEDAVIEVREIGLERVAPSGAEQLEVYQAVADLLSGARYEGSIDDRATVALRLDGPLPPSALDGDDFGLSRLEFLADADPFLGDGWPLQRADLTAVYPFEGHLRRVAQSFRRRYVRLRGRL